MSKVEKKSIKNNSKEVAIKVKNVSKTFRIPHEKISSVKGAVLGAFKSNSYEEFKALDDVSFEVKKGEFFGIIGRNGSGKSTLLKVLAGIYQADKGAVEIDGMISPFLELGIGFNPELSGRDNIYLNATVLGMTKKQIDEKFESIVKFSELERFIDQKLKNYSSGMSVRLAFSVSVHANREILLMDEVLAVGDNNFQSKCLTEFNKYRDMGRTVIIVTHDTSVVERYCDRAMLLRNGMIVEIGKASNIVTKYIQSNISDEKELVSVYEKESKVKSSSKLRNFKSKRIIEIGMVEFIDKEGNKENVFRSGDDISIRIYFKQNKDIKKLNFGLGIYNQEGFYFGGFSTIRDNINTDRYKQNKYYQINLKNVPLNDGSYYLKINIAGDDFSDYYDYIDRSREIFKIFSLKRNPGNVDFDYTWE